MSLIPLKNVAVSTCGMFQKRLHPAHESKADEPRLWLVARRGFNKLGGEGYYILMEHYVLLLCWNKKKTDTLTLTDQTVSP